MPTRGKLGHSLLDDDAYQDWSDDEDDEDQYLHLPNEEAKLVLASIEKAIDTLGGAVSPKLNWSCPKDAVWVATGNTHRCTNADEVLLLLKSSDRVSHDICESLQGLNEEAGGSLPPVLALRKWHKLSPEREFRCFVLDNRLVGVSQRQVTEHFPGLVLRKNEYLELLIDFYEDCVEYKFAEKNFTYDVYLTSAGKVKLLDFNPIYGSTNPLLFSWAELGYAEKRDCIEPGGRNGRETEDSHDVGSTKEAGCAKLVSEKLPRVQTPPRADSHVWQSNDAHNSNDMGRTDCGHCHASSVNADDTAEGTGHDRISVEFRVVTEPNKVQPNMPLYGVPFDMIDSSENSAYSDLVEKLREKQMRGSSFDS